MKISILMSIYNEPIDWIKDSIDSVLKQTFLNFEFIIVNDNPERKENEKILNDFHEKDNRIVIITNEENIGLTKSLNKVLKLAKGKYIARMDADDISLQDRISKQYDFMENNPKYIVCGTQIKYFGKTDESYPKWIKYNDEEIKEQLLLDSCFVHPTVMIRKDVLVKNNVSYDEDFKHAQDYKLWSDLSHLGKFHNLDEILLLYRISESQISLKKSSSQKESGQRIRRSYLSTFLSDEIMNEAEDNLSLDFLIRIKKEIKDLDSSVRKKIVLIVYLSIKKNTLSLLMYYIYSLDFVKNYISVSNLLRVLENGVFPKRKMSRL